MDNLTPGQQAIIDCLKAADGKLLSAHIIAKRVRSTKQSVKQMIYQARRASFTVRQHVASVEGVTGGYRWVE